MEWQELRNILFKEASGIDKYKIQKEQAGIKRLAPYSNYYENKTLVQVTGYNLTEVQRMDDGYATKTLLSMTEKANFDERLNEILHKNK